MSKPTDLTDDYISKLTDANLPADPQVKVIEETLGCSSKAAPVLALKWEVYALRKIIANDKPSDPAPSKSIEVRLKMAEGNYKIAKVIGTYTSGEKEVIKVEL